jgi:hypothetical protein
MSYYEKFKLMKDSDPDKYEREYKRRKKAMQDYQARQKLKTPEQRK